METSKDTPKKSKDQFMANHDEPSYFGITLSILIVILMCILAGLYLWSESLQNNSTPVPETVRPSAEMNNEPESTNAEADVETLNAMSTSDEVDAIEADLESTSVTELEADMTAIETEL